MVIINYFNYITQSRVNSFRCVGILKFFRGFYFGRKPFFLNILTSPMLQGANMGNSKWAPDFASGHCKSLYCIVSGAH